MYDAGNQIAQFLGYAKLQNHHPVLHTVIMGICVKLGWTIYNFNFGVFIFTMLQTVVLAGTLSYTIKYLKKLNIHIGYRIALLLIYSLVIIFPVTATIDTKDVLYTSFAILYTIMYYELINRKKEDISVKNIVFSVIISLLFAIFRKEGLYILILSFPILFILNKKSIKKLLIIFITTIFIYCAYSTTLKILNIPNGSIKEALALPFQQTATYINEYPDEVTEEEKQVIDKLLNYSTIQERFVINNVDPIKAEYNNKATGENKEGTTDIIDMDNINNAVMEENYINVGYKKPYKYIIDYVEKDNESHVLKHVDGAEEYGTDIAIGEESFMGYILVENQTVPEKITITDNEESNSIKIYYEKATYKITYKIEGEYFTNEKYAEEEYKYEEEVTAKEAPNKAGYTFSGWSEIPNTMPAHDVEVKGHYTANGNTAYKVEHYIEDLNGEYILKDTESLTGTTGAKVQYSEKEYEGYTYDASKTENGEASISGEGDTVVKLYYTRNKYQYTIKHVEKGKESNVLEEEKAEAAYGTEIEVKSKEYEGYTYDSKDKDKIEITGKSIFPIRRNYWRSF